MAQKVIVSLIDDLTGDQADETVEFGIDGKNYEIDLTSKNADKLRDAFAKFIPAARRPSTNTRVRSQARTATTVSRREQTMAVRAWAKQQGMKVSDRGRIPADVQEAFDAAH